MINKISKEEVPQLLIREEELIDLIKSYINKETVIFSDDHNFDLLSKIGNTKLVTSCNNDDLLKIKKDFYFSRIIAVGGCTVLDM